jgi:hypothetical protein
MITRTIARAARAALAGAALAALPASLAAASVLDLCDVTARVKSIEEVSVLGAGSRKVVSEEDPTQVRFNSFAALMTLEVLDVQPFAPPAECGMERGGELHQVLVHGAASELRPGAQLKLLRELYVDLTPEGVVYELIWSIPFDR